MDQMGEGERDRERERVEERRERGVVAGIALWIRHKFKEKNLKNRKKVENQTKLTRPVASTRFGLLP